MRSIEIEVSPKGVKLLVTSSTRTGIAKAIFVVPDGVEVHLAPPEAAPSAKPELSKPISSAARSGSAKQALGPKDIAARLKKLKVKNKPGAINSIEAMFQFTTPLTDDEALKKLLALRSAKLLVMDSAGHIAFPDA